MSLDGAAAMPEQLLLPFGRKDQTPLDTTLDSLRERFGRSVLTRASLLGRNVELRDPEAARLTNRDRGRLRPCGSCRQLRPLRPC